MAQEVIGKLRNRHAGFTIVELLIVIVVIGILAALVLNTFSGVQARGRNTERQADIKSLASQLEFYYNDPTTPVNYPLPSTIVAPVSTTAAQGVLKGIDANALQAPGGSSNSLVNAAAPTTAQYGYVANQAGTTTACATAPACGTYTLYWNEEAVSGSAGGIKSKDALNR